MRVIIQRVNSAMLISQATRIETGKGMVAMAGIEKNDDQSSVKRMAKRLFDALAHSVRLQHDRVETGAFGADMQITLTNDGPVTFILQS